MERETPTGERRPGFRRWFRVIAIFLAIPLVFLLVGNIALTSPWSRKWISGKLSSRTGLETRMGQLYCSPWGGITVGELEMLQPLPLRATTKEPIIRVLSVKIQPVWKSFFKGRLEVMDIELDTPRIVLPLELVSHLAKAPPSPSPQIAITGSPPVITAVTPESSQPKMQEPLGEAPPATAKPPTASQVPPSPESKPSPPAITSPTRWLKLKNASFSLVFATKDINLLEFSDITGDIPIAGKPARSSLKTGSISSLGNQISSPAAIALDWTHPMLSLQPDEFEIQGCKITAAAKIGRTAGFPIQMEMKMPRQKPEDLHLPFEGRASVESVASRALFQGFLLAPAGWQGNFVMEANQPVFNVFGQTTKFDRAAAITVLRGGVLSCVDARLTGEDASLLGNATLLADGRCAAALRLVASPEATTFAVKRVLPNLEGEPSLTPLSTPQRMAFDLEASGDISHIFLRLGKDGPVVEFKP